MNIHFAPEHHERRVRIKVIGVGGAGGNAVNRMVEAGLAEVDFYAVNTDGQALDTSRAHQTLVIGDELTRGLGAGGDPSLGRRAAEEDRALLAGLVEDADMVFVTAGMGGGTGTGAAPVVAQVAREGGALTVAVVTRPFLFEGRRRAEQAEAGLEALRDHVDAMLVIPNERLMEIEVADIAMSEVFRVADNVLYEATRGISDIISQHAVVNLDFADVRTVMKDSGAAIMGTGRASGQDRALQAAEVAINSPLLEDVDIHGSRAVLVYLTAREVTRNDLAGAMNLIQEAAGTDAHIFFGFGNDDALGDDLLVTVIATGFPGGCGERAITTAAARPHGVAADGAPAAASPMPADHVPAIEEPEAELASYPDPEAEAELQPVREPQADAFLQREPQRDPDLASDPGLVLQPAPPADSADDSPDEPDVEPDVEVEIAVEAEAEPEVVSAAVEATSVGLAALAAAAGGGAEVNVPSATAQRFLEPLGTVKLTGEEQADVATETNQRFRRSVLSQDKTRPAWERKYVD